MAMYEIIEYFLIELNDKNNFFSHFTYNMQKRVLTQYHNIIIIFLLYSH